MNSDNENKNLLGFSVRENYFLLIYAMCPVREQLIHVLTVHDVISDIPNSFHLKELYI